MVVVSTKIQMLLKKALLVVLSLLVTKASQSLSFESYVWRCFKD